MRGSLLELVFSSTFKRIHFSRNVKAHVGRGESTEIDLFYPLTIQTKSNDLIFSALILCFSQSRQLSKASASKFHAFRNQDQVPLLSYFGNDTMSFVVETNIIRMTESCVKVSHIKTQLLYSISNGILEVIP